MRLSNFNILLSVLATVASALPYSDDALNTAATELTSDQQNALNIHNTARKEVNVPALSWDSGLQQKAQNWANHLASQSGGNLVHSGSGENLYAEKGVNSNTPLVDGSNGWYHEKPNYHHEQIPQGDFESYGHFSKPIFYALFYHHLLSWRWRSLTWCH
jgi:pathogenesis-related protein 1